MSISVTFLTYNMNPLGIYMSLRNAMAGLKRRASTFDRKPSLSSALEEDGNKHSCHTCEDRIAGLSLYTMYWLSYRCHQLVKYLIALDINTYFYDNLSTLCSTTLIPVIGDMITISRGGSRTCP